MRQFGVEVSIIEPGSIATEIWDKGHRGGAGACASRWARRWTSSTASELDRMEALAAKTGPAGLPPETVAEAVEHALTAEKPKARYMIGREAKIQARRPHAAAATAPSTGGRARDRERLTTPSAGCARVGCAGLRVAVVDIGTNSTRLLVADVVTAACARSSGARP